VAQGKNSKNIRKKKGNKKVIDPFSRKEWWDIKAPAPFAKRNVGKTLATKTIGIKTSRDSLMGRVVEVSLGDLEDDGEDNAFKKFKLRVENVQGSQCLTNFYGMDLTTDKLRSLVRKWHTKISAYCDVTTTDGYKLRLFCIGFTKRRPNQIRTTSYAQTTQIKAIRKKMIEIMQREASIVDLTELVAKLKPGIIGREIEKVTEGIYPLQNVFIRKVKTLRAPKTDIGKLNELHSSSGVDSGKKIERD